MATENRQSAGDVEAFTRLQERPEDFELFEALRVLERMTNGYPRFGRAQRWSDEAIRIRQRPTLGFARSSVAGVKVDSAAFTPIVDQVGVGLLGPNGPMPLHLTEIALGRREREDDPALLEFLDIFHHRYVCLLYRAWAAGRPTVNRDREDDDRFTGWVAALIGAQTRSGKTHPDAELAGQLYAAGRMAALPRNAESLAVLVAEEFDVAVQVEQFAARWLRVPAREQTRLGGARSTCRLGQLAALGSRSWQGQHSFRLRIGPMDWQRFLTFLPGSKAQQTLDEIVASYLKVEYDWDIRLLVQADQIPGVTLGRQGAVGWTSWLGGGGDALSAEVVLRNRTRDFCEHDYSKSVDGDRAG